MDSKFLNLTHSTKGQTYSLNNTRYAIWQYDYNGWTILSAYLISIGSSEYSPNSVDIVDLFTNTLATLSELEANSLLDICLKKPDHQRCGWGYFPHSNDSAYLNINPLAEAFVKFASVLLPFSILTECGRISVAASFWSAMARRVSWRCCLVLSRSGKR